MGGFVGRPGMLKSPAMQEALKPLHRLEVEAVKNNEKVLKRKPVATTNHGAPATLFVRVSLADPLALSRCSGNFRGENNCVTTALCSADEIAVWRANEQ